MKILRTYLLLFLFVSCSSSFSFGQITYFDQDFNCAGPFYSSTPSQSQFDTLLTTSRFFSTFIFGNGTMEMKRATNFFTGGSGTARAVRSTAFLPNPETLYAQFTFSAQNITSTGAPACYFYIGNNFDKTNSTFPNDTLMFSKIALNLVSNGFVIHDFTTGYYSSVIPMDQSVTITWVLNNSKSSVPYKFPETASVANYSVGPLKYDLWIDNTLAVDEASGYLPASRGTTNYNPIKLSNFELRFYNGIGSILFDKILIRDIDGSLPITIYDLKSERINSDVKLTWAMGGTWDATYNFQVERSKDGLEFETIGTVPVYQLQHLYEFKEEFTPSGDQFYRIVGMDSKGEITAKSKIVFVKGEVDASLASNISPNPVESNFFELNENEPTSHYKVYNSVGSEVPIKYTNEGNTKVGFYPVEILPAGLYVVEYHRANSIVRKKVVVR